MWMWDSTILLIIVVGYPLSDIEVTQPKLEYGIFRDCTVLVYCTTRIKPTKIKYSLSNRTS
jgi:hypothetical protein